MNTIAHNNEQEAAKAFSKQSIHFDELYRYNTIVGFKRERVRNHLLQFLRPNAQILELNSGTGDDAVWFGERGFRVHATDISEGMQEMLRHKITAKGLQHSVSQELCSFTTLDKLQNRGPYDYIFSNFAGLNCTGKLAKVLNSFDDLLVPGGYVTMVILPKFCLWETLLLFKGKWQTAKRRLFGSRSTAHIEGEYFDCWYFNPAYVIKNMKASFELVDLEGLCTIVPPSYIEGFAEKRPRLFNFLSAKERRWSRSWPWKSIGDYYIISFRKK